MATRAMRELAFTHDDRRLVSADIPGVFNLHSVPVDGGEPSPLTRSVTDNNEVVSTFPTDIRILRPLMVLQGANDPRVSTPESEDVAAAVKKNIVPVEDLLFPDEGPGFRKKTQVAGYGGIATFLET